MENHITLENHTSVVCKMRPKDQIKTKRQIEIGSATLLRQEWNQGIRNVLLLKLYLLKFYLLKKKKINLIQKVELHPQAWVILAFKVLGTTIWCVKETGHARCIYRDFSNLSCSRFLIQHMSRLHWKDVLSSYSIILYFSWIHCKRRTLLFLDCSQLDEDHNSPCHCLQAIWKKCKSLTGVLLLNFSLLTKFPL